MAFIDVFLYICSWTEFRAQQAIEKVLRDGLAWVDDQDEEKSYWFPSLFPGRQVASVAS